MKGYILLEFFPAFRELGMKSWMRVLETYHLQHPLTGVMPEHYMDEYGASLALRTSLMSSMILTDDEIRMVFLDELKRKQATFGTVPRPTRFIKRTPDAVIFLYFADQGIVCSMIKYYSITPEIWIQFSHTMVMEGDERRRANEIEKYVRERCKVAVGMLKGELKAYD